ncbi:MAG: hypothetical protein AB8B99_18070 [Phormidesmis sp.]
MEIAALTAFLTPFLPFLLKLGKGAAETATENAANKFGEAAWHKAQSVWTTLGPKLEAKDNAEAVTDVANNPEDEDYQTVLRVQLKKLLANDEALTNQLTKLLQEGNSNPSSITHINQSSTGDQSQNIGKVSGGTVFGNITGSVIIGGSGNSVTSTSVSSIPTELSSSASSLPVKTILVLAANPKDTNPLRLGEEVREIQAGLDRSKLL